MIARPLPVGAVVGVLVAGPPVPALGQATAGLDATLRSRYEWRGITRRDAFVWQVDALGGYRFGTAYVTAGVWTSLELAKPNHRAEPVADFGFGRRAGEWNAWLEGSATFGRHDLAAGVTGYHFPDPARARLLGVEVFDTWEVYARWRPRLGRLTPGVAVWIAMEDVHGAYVELTTAYRLHALPLFFPAVHLEALAGLSADLAADSDGPGPYVSNGFTHAIVSFSSQLHPQFRGLERLYLTPAIRVQVNGDPATRMKNRLAPEDRSSVTSWFELAASWYLR